MTLRDSSAWRRGEHMAGRWRPPDEDADVAYPEHSGYEEFVREHAKTLENFATLRDDSSTEKLLRKHLQLILESSHTMVRSRAVRRPHEEALTPLRVCAPCARSAGLCFATARWWSVARPWS